MSILAGTVAIANGATTLTGTDTSFVGSVFEGDEIRVDLPDGSQSRAYLVTADPTSETVLSFTPAFYEGAISGAKLWLNPIAPARQTPVGYAAGVTELLQRQREAMILTGPNRQVMLNRATQANIAEIAFRTDGEEQFKVGLPADDARWSLAAYVNSAWVAALKLAVDGQAPNQTLALSSEADASSLIEQAIQYSQAGTNMPRRPVLTVLREWHKLQDYGGGPEMTAAQNATALGSAFLALREGGELIIPPGRYNIDRTDFSALVGASGTATGARSVTIRGVSNPSGGADTNTMLLFDGAGTDPVWNFDSPADLSIANITLEKLHLVSRNDAFTGDLIRASTPVTDGSTIHFSLTLQDMQLAQDFGTTKPGTCQLLNIGKAIETYIRRVNFFGGKNAIIGQQGQTVAGIAQARQNVVTRIEMCQFLRQVDWVIRYGGENWILDTNVFEPNYGGQIQAFMTNSDYPILNMRWVNNWFGDTVTPGYQIIVVCGKGFWFENNRIAGAWSGSGPGNEGVHLQDVVGFRYVGNVQRGLSAGLSTGTGVCDYGTVEDNVSDGLVGATIGSNNFGAHVRVGYNSPA